MTINTIYALSTPFGRSGVAVIRISGDKIEQLIKDLGITQKLKPRYAYFKNIYHPQKNYLLDQALILYFKAPNSFTGEDILELQIHGGRAVINATLDALSHLNYLRMAEAGEFSKRAFLNGKIDLTQAEAIVDLIDAETLAQQQQAAKQMSGVNAQKYNSWRDQILHLSAFTESLIDFPEEDIPDTVIEEISYRQLKLIAEIEKHLDDNNRGEKIRNGVKVAIIGKPNVGKSSLLNHLAKREVAIVSDVPGTTRDVLEVQLDIAGVPFILYDTAGIRHTQDHVESIGIKKAENIINNADVILHLVTADDHQTLKINVNQQQLYLKVYTKSDINPEVESHINISVKNETTVDQIINYLADYGKEFIFHTEDEVITRSRYREHCQFCLESLHRFNLEDAIEIAAEDLRIAAFELGKITGKVDVEELLGIIFGSFCIGK